MYSLLPVGLPIIPGNKTSSINLESKNVSLNEALNLLQNDTNTTFHLRFVETIKLQLKLVFQFLFNFNVGVAWVQTSTKMECAICREKTSIGTLLPCQHKAVCCDQCVIVWKEKGGRGCPFRCYKSPSPEKSDIIFDDIIVISSDEDEIEDEVSVITVLD